MNAELEENKELAGNRLNELEELRQDLEQVTTQNEKLKVTNLYLFEDEGVLCSWLPSVLLNCVSRKPHSFCACSFAGWRFVQFTKSA